MIESADEVPGAGGLSRAMKEEFAQARYPAFFRDASPPEARAVEIRIMPMERQGNAGPAGPFTLMETSDGKRVARRPGTAFPGPGRSTHVSR
ncbi:hypothetical protein [Streptomyces alkaliphilus]|uniref:hypothetical protein n=1 Tax=Streptomyces alkaliphilus TaxID=1472722 RepID=UPI002B1FE573|nr:hypothetical protein [Streptomyces alkaliphilus]